MHGAGAQTYSHGAHQNGRRALTQNCESYGRESDNNDQQTANNAPTYTVCTGQGQAIHSHASTLRSNANWCTRSSCIRLISPGAGWACLGLSSPLCAWGLQHVVNCAKLCALSTCTKIFTMCTDHDTNHKERQPTGCLPRISVRVSSHIARVLDPIRFRQTLHT